MPPGPHIFPEGVLGAVRGCSASPRSGQIVNNSFTKMNQTAGELETEARSYQVRLAIKRVNPLSLRHFFLFAVIFLLSGCLGLGGDDSLASRYGTPQMPAATEVTGSLSLSGNGAGSTITVDRQAADASAAGDSVNGPSIGPQLEALTSEIRSLRGRFEAMEPAINRLVRVEQDMTELIAEMELLANDPVPFVAPADLFGLTTQSPDPAAPLVSARQGDTEAQSSADTNQGQMPTSGRGVISDNQNIPTLSLRLPDAFRTVGPGGQESPGASNSSGQTPAQVSAQPPNQPGQPGQAGNQARLAVNETPGRSATTTGRGLPGQQSGQACDAFGLHVGSYLLQESVVFAREDIRERYASIMQGLRYAFEDVDLRDGRGTFHRLIAGPVVGYEQATALCADMEANGNYCKVTFYNPPECDSPYN